MVNSLRLCLYILMALGPKLCSNIRLILVVRGSVSTVILVPGVKFPSANGLNSMFQPGVRSLDRLTPCSSPV